MHLCFRTVRPGPLLPGDREGREAHSSRGDGDGILHCAPGAHLRYYGAVQLGDARESWMEWGGIGGTPLLLLLACGFALSLYFAWRRVRGAGGSLGRTRQGVVLGLRFLTALMLLGVAVQPRWTSRELEEIPGKLAVLIDGSRSMQVASGADSRAGVARGLLEGWAAEAEERGVSVYRFGARLEATTWEDASERRVASQDATELGTALEELIETEPELGGVVVLSDGRADIAEEQLERLQDTGVQLHGVALGAQDQLRDDAIAELQADPVAFLRQQAEVRVVVRSWGNTETRRVPVALRAGEELVREAVVQVPPGGEGEVILSFVPRRLGRAVYQVSIPTAADDAVPANNERAFLVNVSRDRLRVLLVAGQPSWDVRFLRAFLKRDPSIDLISFFILRTNSDLTRADGDELALIPFPTDELFREHLGSFDVLLFQNFDFAPYQMAAYLPRIRAYVRRGGAFAMIGGDRSFASGGYGATPIAEVLPVELPLGQERFVEGAFSPRLSAENSLHPLVALAPEPGANATLWANLAPMVGANQVTGIRDGAQVLLEGPSRAGDVPPVLVVGGVEEGRVAALLSDTSWRWGMTTAGRSGDASAYDRFWDRMLRWLSRDPALEPAQLTTDREGYGPGSPVRATGLLRDEHYRPLQGAAEIVLLRGDGEELLAEPVQGDGRGHLEHRLQAPEQPGAYRLSLRRAGQSEALSEVGFIVETGGAELADPRPAPEVLQGLAERSRGQYATAEEEPSLERFEAIRTRRRGATTWAPLQAPWVLGMVLCVLGLEWWLRRRWGLK